MTVGCARTFLAGLALALLVIAIVLQAAPVLIVCAIVVVLLIGAPR